MPEPSTPRETGDEPTRHLPDETRALPWVGRAVPTQPVPAQPEPTDPFWPPIESHAAYPVQPQVGYPIAMPTPPRRRKRRRWLWLTPLLATIVCCCGVPAAVYLSMTQQPPASHAGLNTAVRDGKFEFVVTSVDCGRPTVTSGPLSRTAQGRYCLVKLTVRNIGDEGQTFADSYQKAVGPDGERFSADTGVGLLANRDGTAAWNLINPGNSISATVVFDIPTNVQPARLELHDSPFSGGVTVEL